MRILNGLLLAALICWCNCAHADVFSWADYGLDISDVQAGDAFVFTDVDGSGIDFEFSFQESFGRRSTINQTIINPTNPDGSSTNYTGNGNVESLYSSDPLYLIGEGTTKQDSVILTITPSRPINLTDMLVGDIDRYFGRTISDLDSYQDLVRIQPTLGGVFVNPTITTNSNTIMINGRSARARANQQLTSADIDSQINVSAKEIDKIQIIFRNIDRDGESNSHMIAFGNDQRFFSFSVPEPSSALVLGLFLPMASLRRRRN